MAIKEVWLVGISPYPKLENDSRLPHVATRATNEIHKTALGAEKTLTLKHFETSELETAVSQLKKNNYLVVALEQTTSAKNLKQFKAPAKLALMVGNEVEGLNEKLLNMADETVMIPMLGAKESLNVAVAAGMALYKIRFGE